METQRFIVLWFASVEGYRLGRAVPYHPAVGELNVFALRRIRAFVITNARSSSSSATNNPTRSRVSIVRTR